MSRVDLRERIRQGLFLLDGAMGTQLIVRGAEAGKCNDYLNIESPDIIFDIHCAYLQAGSDAVLTNTFGANKCALKRHGLAEKVEDINGAAARIARKAAGDDKYVLGDIGPSGDFLEPLGSLKPEELKDAFAEQASVLSTAGVDGLIIETMTALDEVGIAVEAVKSVCELPVFVSFAFDRAGGDFRTMMGVSVESAVSKAVSLGVDAVGFNCGTATLDEYTELAGKYVSAVKQLDKNMLIFAEPNAGKPELVEDKVVYNVSVDEFAAMAEEIHLAGFNILGGCCGTNPEYIEAVAKRLRK